MLVSTAFVLPAAIQAIVTSATFSNLLLGMAGSYIANQISNLNAVSFEKSVEKAY